MSPSATPSISKITASRRPPFSAKLKAISMEISLSSVAEKLSLTLSVFLSQTAFRLSNQPLPSPSKGSPWFSPWALLKLKPSPQKYLSCSEKHPPVPAASTRLPSKSPLCSKKIISNRLLSAHPPPAPEIPLKLQSLSSVSPLLSWKSISVLPAGRRSSSNRNTLLQ